MWIRLCRCYSTASWFQYITPYWFYLLHACCVYIHLCQCVSASISVCKNPGPPNVWAPHIIINPICRRALWAFTPTVQKATTQHCFCPTVWMHLSPHLQTGLFFRSWRNAGADFMCLCIFVYSRLCVFQTRCVFNTLLSIESFQI